MQNLIGYKFGRWTVAAYSHKNGPHHYWQCVCDCGNHGTVQQASLGKTSSSCGCLRKDKAIEQFKTHGATYTKLYDVWQRMRQRCSNPNAYGYPAYGGRGIKVCERWETYKNFELDMGPTYQEGLTIDRVDNNGNYELSNCRWTTKKDQARNRRNSALIETKWGVMTISEFAERTGISRDTITYWCKSNSEK